MRARSRQNWWVGMLLCGAAACGQELVLPQNKPTGSAAGAPSEGVTGASGAPDDAGPRPRLPVAEQPVFTTFGGAGGDSAVDDKSLGGNAGFADQSTGGSKPSGGTGGAKPNGGAAGSSGAKSNGGAAGSGGAKPNGGAAGSSGAKSNGGAAGSGGLGLAGEAGSGGVTSGVPGPAALMFSEYVEGSGSFKALEIYALDASSLEGCELQTYFNGKFEPSRLALHGELAQGAVQVLCSSALATAQPTLCDRSTSLTFNGNDALALSCDGTLLDVIGQIGVDPGDSWGVGATADHTLRRRCSVTLGRSDGNQSFEIDAEWLTLGVDTFSDLGQRDCALP